jgi:GNAT superfamily N-acetyltransferase
MVKVSPTLRTSSVSGDGGVVSENDSTRSAYTPEIGMSIKASVRWKALVYISITFPIEYTPPDIDKYNRFTLRCQATIFLLRGQGFGGKLLRALVEESKQVGTPLYLEATTERNVRMYERLGFRLLNQIILPVINLPLWEMVREPRTG